MNPYQRSIPLKIQQAVARMVVTDGQTFEAAMERYPDISVYDIEYIIERFRPGEKGMAAKSIGVCLGSKQEPYWENEMDTWTGKVEFDNRFSKLKFKDVEREKSIKINEFIS